MDAVCVIFPILVSRMTPVRCTQGPAFLCFKFGALLRRSISTSRGHAARFCIAPSVSVFRMSKPRRGLDVLLVAHCFLDRI